MECFFIFCAIKLLIFLNSITKLLCILFKLFDSNSYLNILLYQLYIFASDHDLYKFIYTPTIKIIKKNHTSSVSYRKKRIKLCINTMVKSCTQLNIQNISKSELTSFTNVDRPVCFIQNFIIMTFIIICYLNRINLDKYLKVDLEKVYDQVCSLH